MTSKEENMLEKCARAIVKSNRSWEDRWEDLLDTERKGYMDNARAVSEALMEPMPEMLQAIYEASTPASYVVGDVEIMWKAVLQSILQSKEEGEGR